MKRLLVSLCFVMLASMYVHESKPHRWGPRVKYRTYSYHELWRDNRVVEFEKQGSHIHWRRLDDDTEFEKELRAKLIEVSDEAKKTKNQDEMLAALADVLEVTETLLYVHGYTLDDLRAVQTKRRYERGGFGQRVLVEKAEHPIGSFSDKYCLAHPEKYTPIP